MQKVEAIVITPKEIEGSDKVIPAFVRKKDDFEEVYKLLKSLNVDIVHVQHEYGIFGRGEGLIKLIKRLKEEGIIKSAVITMHSVWTEVKDTWFQRKLNVFDVVLVHSQCQLYELKWQGVKGAHLIPHGTLLNPYVGKYRELRRELGIGNEKVALVPGFVRRDKNVDKVVRVAREVGYLPLVAGEIKDEVDLTGALVINRYLSTDEMLKLYASSDVIIFFYRDHKGVYSVSGALHLALGSFKPIIGTSTPRLVEMSIVPEALVNDIEDLKIKLKYIMENEEEYLRRLAPLFSYGLETRWEVVAREHEKLYSKLVESAQGRS